MADIHKYKQRLKRTLERIKESRDILEHNKKIILDFHSNCLIQGLSSAKTERYLYDAFRFAIMYKKELDNATEKELKKIVAEIETRDWTISTKQTFKLGLRKLYKFIDEIFKRVFQRFLPHKKTMIIIVTFLILASITAGIQPTVTLFVIENRDNSANFIISLIALIIGLNIIWFIFSYIHRSKMNRMVYQVCFRMRRDSNYQVLMQDLSFFDKFPTGKIVSRINSDGQRFGEAANLFLNAIASILLLLIVIVPHSGEVFLSLTSLQWITSILILFQILQENPKNHFQAITDLIILVLVGLTGPFY